MEPPDVPALGAVAVEPVLDPAGFAVPALDPDVVLPPAAGELDDPEADEEAGAGPPAVGAPATPPAVAGDDVDVDPAPGPRVCAR